MTQQFQHKQCLHMEVEVKQSFAFQNQLSFFLQVGFGHTPQEAEPEF